MAGSMFKKWTSAIASPNKDKLLQGNQKIGMVESPLATLSPITSENYSPLSPKANPFAPLQDQVSLQSYRSNLNSQQAADEENVNRMQHNLNVDNKIAQEEYQRAMEEAQNAWNAGRDSATMTGDIGDLSGLGLSAEQQSVANTIINTGRQRGFSDSDIRVALMTGLAESGLKNVNYGDRDSLGVFQQRPSQGWGSASQVSNVDYATNKFYDTLETTKRGANEWNTAQNVQRSAFADGSNYKAQYSLANKILVAANNPVGTSVVSNAPVSKWLNSQVGKRHDFDGMYGTQCVDFFRYYNQYLGFNQPPSLSSAGGSGGAKELWSNPAVSSAMKQNYNQVARSGKAQTGYVAVFGGSLGSGYGHVGVVLKDNGTTLTIINSNSSTVGNGKPTNIITINKSALLGYYAPKG